MKQRRYQTRTATVNLENMISQAKSQSSRSNTDPNFDDLATSTVPDQLRQSKNQAKN